MKKYILQIFLATIFLMIIMASAQALQTTYNYSSNYEGKTMFAKNCNTNWRNSVPLNGPIPTCNGVLSDTTYNSALDLSDNRYVTSYDNSVDVWQLYYGSLSTLTSTNTITQLKWTWEGGKTHGGGIIKLYLWNTSSKSWKLTDSLNGSSTTDYTRQLTISDPNNYLTSDKKVYMLMYYQHAGSNQLPRTDYVKLDINYTSKGQAGINLGTAGSFVILTKSGISTTGTTSIVGDIGVSPIAATGITGFGLIKDSSNQFSRSSLVTGRVYAANYAPPTPAKMTTAVSDMEIAYTDAAGRTNPSATELGAGDISKMTLTPGLYKWGTGVIINNGVTLNCQGNTNAVFIFQIAQSLTVGNGAIVTLSGGCQASNIFWQVGGQATLGTTSKFKGNILSKTLIAMNTGSTLNGKALAQTAVTLNANHISA